MKYTSAEAGKMVKKLEVEIRKVLLEEEKSSVFNAASTENPEELRPEYDFKKTQKKLEALQEMLRKTKHAINEFNVSHSLPGFDGLTVDQALVYIPMLTERKKTLFYMSTRLPRERVGSRFGSGNIIDYAISNFDKKEAEEKYEEVSELLSKMQLALDTVNTSETMEIDVEL